MPQKWLIWAKNWGMGANVPLQLNVCFQILSLLADIIVSGGGQSKSFTSLTCLICFFTSF